MLTYISTNLKKILVAVGTAIAGILLALFVAMRRQDKAASTLSQSEATTKVLTTLETRDDELKKQYEKLVPRNGDPEEVRRRLRERGLIK